MEVCCIDNKGKALMEYEYDIIKKGNIGRFGASEESEYNDLKIGHVYQVMGIVIFESYQAYIVDFNEFISIAPCQLFKVIDDKINCNWYFRLIKKNETIYPFIQAVFGYKELCKNEKEYENLIVEQEKEAYNTYFLRKKEMYPQLILR